MQTQGSGNDGAALFTKDYIVKADQYSPHIIGTAIAIWLEHESLGTRQIYFGCKPRHERGNPGENATAEE
jgi:hypothetical protein